MKSGALSYKGNNFNFSQNVNEIANVLPRLPEQLNEVVVRRPGVENNYKDFKNDKNRIITALLYLKRHNRYYLDIDFDAGGIASLPGAFTKEAQVDSVVLDEINNSIDEDLIDESEGDLIVRQNTLKFLQLLHLLNNIKLEQPHLTCMKKVRP